MTKLFFPRPEEACSTDSRPHTASPALRVLVWSAMAWGVWLLTSLFSQVVMAGSEIRYEVAIKGVSRELCTVLEEISDTVLLKKERPPGSLSLLRRRANKDSPLLLKALKAAGYYDAQLTTHVDDKTDPVRVTFQITLGPPYLLKSVEIQRVGPNTRPEVTLPAPVELGLDLEKTASARAVLDGQEELIKQIKRQGFPFPRIVERRVTVDHAERAVAVVFSVDPGPSACFGSTSIFGLKFVDEGFVRGKIPWRYGDRFSPDMFSLLEKELTETGLFATVQVKIGESLEKGGLLPVSITVRERKHRTVSAAASYKSDEGLGGMISWEHRNLRHSGDRLRLKATGSEISAAAETEFRKSQFLRDDQLITFTLRAADERPDAFTSRNVYTSLAVDRTLANEQENEMILGGGLAFKAEWVEQLGEEDCYGLVSVPLHFFWNTSDSLLDPSCGGRLILEFAPFYNTFGSGLSFTKGKIAYSRYVPILTRPFLVLAGRAGVGSIRGADRDDIPADERFYAGGGGSIRGYPFQSVGPLDGTNPVGGRSILELSAELRLKLDEHMGIVVFFDGGNAFTGSIGDSGENLVWSAGCGFRFFTGIGPVRLDIGVPMDRREGIDDSYQIYLSLGQAF